MNPRGIPAASKEPATGHRDPERLGCYNATQQPEIRGDGTWLRVILWGPRLADIRPFLNHSKVHDMV